MQIDPAQLKQFLLDANLISRADLSAAEEESTEKKTSLEDVLVSSGKIKSDDFRRLKAYVLGVPFVDLKGIKIERVVLDLIPEPVARKHNIIAFKRSDNGLEVAMLDPEDLEAIDFIKKGVGAKILPRLTDEASIKAALVQYQKSLKDEFGELIRREAAALTGNIAEPDEAALKKIAADLPMVRLVDTLLAHAVLQQASDIHLEPYENELVVRYRIDGILHDAMILPKGAAAGLTARIKVLANLRLDEKRLPQDGRFKIETQGQKVSFRVSILPTYFGEKIVMRLLPDAVSGFSLESSGFHGDTLEAIHKAINQATGLILVTGPTGSGKSTTLYTLLEILNTPDVNISTIEDPIEYQMPRVNQTQVTPDIGLTFASGLRSLVRQDPDIIMVGEIRDKETANLAINAALTGHLVLSTLHTNSAAGAVPRLLDMGVEPFLLASTVNLIIAQRLVRRLCKDHEEYKLPAAEQKRLAAAVDTDHIMKCLHDEHIPAPGTTFEKLPFYRAKPSAECADGYAGRIGIHEALFMAPAIKDLVMNGATADQIEAAARKAGMLTMLEDGIYKAVQGITTLEEVWRVVSV